VPGCQTAPRANRWRHNRADVALENQLQMESLRWLTVEFTPGVLANGFGTSIALVSMRCKRYKTVSFILESVRGISNNPKIIQSNLLSFLSILYALEVLRLDLRDRELPVRF
jgi:hypothetical protein